MGEAKGGSQKRHRRGNDRIHGLVLDYLLGLIAFTGNFYRENEAFIKEALTFGVRPRQSIETAEAESISFFADLLSQSRNELLKKNLLEQIVTGRLPVDRLKDLHRRLYVQRDGSGVKVSRGAIDRIVVFVWKVLGRTNQEISEETGIKKKTVRNHITQIYEIFIPDTERLTPQKRHALLVKTAVEEGFIYQER
jgi:hypothetical protein